MIDTRKRRNEHPPLQVKREFGGDRVVLKSPFEIIPDWKLRAFMKGVLLIDVHWASHDISNKKNRLSLCANSWGVT